MGRSKNRVSFPLLSPNPGTWSLDWSRVDCGGPFPWPERSDSRFTDLAHFLAALNRVDLADVFQLERSYNRGSAVHALSDDSLSESALDRWEEIFNVSVGSEEWGDEQFVSMTYCLREDGGWRVICRFDGITRTMYPLWWDPKHQVSGSSQQPTLKIKCTEEACFHPPHS